MGIVSELNSLIGEIYEHGPSDQIDMIAEHRRMSVLVAYDDGADAIDVDPTRLRVHVDGEGRIVKFTVG
jgi:hypothetical protein